MQNEVVNSGQDLLKLFNSFDDILMVVDSEGKLLRFNEQAEYILNRNGVKLEKGLSIFTFITNEWYNIAENARTNILSSDRPLSIDVALKDAEKRSVFYEVKCVTVTDKPSATPDILIAARDITVQKIFEKKNSVAASDLRDIIENANAIIIGTDTNGYITEWNGSSFELTGFSKSDAYAKRFAELLLENSDHEEFYRIMSEIVRGSRLANYELMIRSKSGRHLSLLLNATFRKNAVGEVVGLLFIGQDITELTAYRQTLERKVSERTEALQEALQKEKQLVEIKNRFVSIASHEFKSPLSSINHAVDSIRSNIENLSKDMVLSQLDGIQSKVQHMNVLLNDLVTIGKAETGKLEAKTRQIDLIKFFDQIIEEVSHHTKNTHTVEFRRPDVLLLDSDEKFLRNIFINLLNNAIKYSPGKDRVFLQISNEGSNIEIVIKDKGIGISEEDLGRVFTPFNRGSNTDEIEGTGLGLSIVKKAVEALGGKLYVESKINQGTIFTIVLKSNISNTAK